VIITESLSVEQHIELCRNDLLGLYSEIQDFSVLIGDFHYRYERSIIPMKQPYIESGVKENPLLFRIETK
jgi:hypothetical protein